MTRRLPVILLCLLHACTGMIAQEVFMPAKRFRLLFAGDIMGHDSQILAAQIEKNALYDYTDCFRYVRPLLQEADLAIGNLELTLPGKPPYSGYPQFRSPEELAIALKYAGFDLMVTANNHSNDGRRQGLINTIKTLDNYGFFQTGTFIDTFYREAFYPLIVYKGHFKLAFLNYTYGTNGLPTTPPGIVNLIEEAQIKTDLQTAKALHPDLIIPVMHWGQEYQLNEHPDQRQLAEKMFDWGADLIVGAHPHVVQPIRSYSTDSLAHLVAFSLGNFISGQKKTHTDIGIILDVELEKDLSQNTTRIVSCHFIPVFRYIGSTPEGKRQYYVLPVSGVTETLRQELGMNRSTYHHMLDQAEALREKLTSAGVREKLVSLPTESISPSSNQ